MLRTMLLAGMAALLAVSFPLLYERNSGDLDALSGSPAPQPTMGAPAQTRLSNVEQGQSARQIESLTGREVRLDADPRGHFIGEFRFNGHRMDAMVDTGASYVAINRTAARRMGLNLLPEAFRHTVSTANGQTRAAKARIDRLQLGRIHIEDVDVLVLDDRSLSGILIGMTFLNRLRRYSVESGALILEQ